MERAGRLLGKSKNSAHGLTDEQLAKAAWKPAVGKKIAEHTAAVALIRDRLVIEVEDNIWQRQLFSLRHQILANLEREAGRKLVAEIEFRVAAPRRGPARAAFATPVDEAAGIEDAGLQRIYIASRRKANG